MANMNNSPTRQELEANIQSAISGAQFSQETESDHSILLNEKRRAETQIMKEFGLTRKQFKKYLKKWNRENKKS